MKQNKFGALRREFAERANERRRSAQHGGVRSIGWLAFILATLLEWNLIRLRKC